MAEGARLGEGAPEPAAAPSRALVLLLAALVTAGGVAGALYLGAWAFDVRRFSTHEHRLTRLLAHTPTLQQVDRAFEDEGTRFVGAGTDAASQRELARRYAGDKLAAIEALGRRCAQTRAYQTADMTYFVCFDAADVMRGFALASR